MTFPTNPENRSPKGDHNRRLSLGLEADALARVADVTTEQLRDYESTGPDGVFDLVVADKVGAALEVMEAVKSPKVDNGAKPDERVEADEANRKFSDETVEVERGVEDTTEHPNPSPMNPAFP